VASPEGLRGCCGRKRRQSLLIAAAQGATALPGHRRRPCQAPGSVLTSERATTLVPARPVAGPGPGSAVCPERRHRNHRGRSRDGDSARRRNGDVQEWEKPSRAPDFKGWRSTKGRAGLMRINHTRGASMGLNADASLVPSADIGRNHYGGRRVKVTGRDIGHWRTASAAAGKQDPRRCKFQGDGTPARGRQLGCARSQNASRRPEESRMTWPRNQRPPDPMKNPGTLTEMSKTSVRRRTRRSPMLTHETSPVLGASVVGMTNGACHGPS
jgi:hypothetical protein